MILADFRLPSRVRRTLNALAPIVCPDDVEALGLVEPVVDGVELHMRAMPGGLRYGLVAGLTAFELGSLALPGYGKTFTSLSAEKRTAYFDSWWHHSSPVFSQLAFGAKGLLCFSYWEHPVVKKRLEYHPERWIAEAAKKRLEKYAGDIRKHEVEILADDPLVPATSLTRKVKHHEAA